VRLKMYLKSSLDRPNPWLVMHANDYIPPIRLSAIAGDCLHNMRSALDNLICGLALTLDRTSNCKKTKFPFTENEPDWNANSAATLQGIPAGAVPILKGLQPWYSSVKPNPLLMLNKLNNTDKHRFCAFGLAHSQDTVIRIHCLNGSAIDIYPKDQMYLGDVQTFDVPVPSTLIGAEPRVHASGTLVINFRDEGPWGTLHVSDVLHRCFEHIEKHVIAKLKPFLEPRVPS